MALPRTYAMVLGSPLDSSSENITVGGTPTVGDVLSVSTTINGSTHTDSYTVKGGDQLADLATGLAYAINADTALNANHLLSRAAGAVVYVLLNASLTTTFSGSVNGAGTEILTFSVDTQTFVAALNNANVDGGACQLGWSQAEQSDAVNGGSYSWTGVDSCVNDALGATGGPKLASILMLASPISATMPLWLHDATDAANCPNQGAQPGYDYYGVANSSKTRYVQGQVVPWDCVYLNRFKSFLAAMAAHLGPSGTNRINLVLNVSQTVPVSELNIVGCTADPGPASPTYGQLEFYGGTSYSNVNTGGDHVPYVRATYLAAVESMVDAYHASFGGKFTVISAPTGGAICGEANGDYEFYVDVMNYATTNYGKEFWMFAADLKAQGPTGPAGSSRMSTYADRTQGYYLMGTTSLGFQGICSATPPYTSCPSYEGSGYWAYDRNLEQGICTGLGLGATYFEIYKADVLNTDAHIQNAIDAVHNNLLCNQ